ncbi:GNAT family N-acetyltransferase [Salsuginibacillus kocurii]|uniref:GNAT family N-acetyltransferase n=1 Tax=Salsuginibacillus kocurii TaxID=427078 RepID=UPI00035FB07F|nr:GNAT family N-acetyltransferase [Salsuginibacillus kocurii]
MNRRYATDADASTIAQFHIEGWQRTYHNIFPSHVLENLDVEERTAQWQEIVKDPRTITELLTTEKGRIAGLISAGPVRDPFILSYDSELYAIYLAPQVQHKGLGKKLFISMADQLKNQGFASMVVWLARENPARSFYESFSPVTVTEKVNQYGVEDIAFGYQLSEISS